LDYWFAAALGGGLLLLVITAFEHFTHRHEAENSLEADARDGCRELLIVERRGANQLVDALEHFSNWWPAIEDENFTGKLPDGYGPTTHQKAVEKLLFKFGQFFSAAWSYQSFCPNHRDAGEVKALVDEVYLTLGKPGQPGDLTDARVDSDELHVIGRLCTEGWGDPEARPFEEIDFKAVLKQHPEEFESLRTFLLKADTGTSARTRLQETEKAAKHVHDRLKEKGYGP